MNWTTYFLFVVAIAAYPVRLESPTNESGEVTEPNYTDETTPDEVTEPTTEETTTVDDYDSTTEYGETTTEDSFSMFEFFTSNEKEDEAVKEEATLAEERVIKLSEQIRNILTRYREQGVITLPGLPVPDPMHVPDFRKVFAGSPMQFMNNTVHGLSNFTVDQINTDIDKKQVFVALHIKRLVMLGNYSLKSWFSKASGPYNVTLLDVQASGAAEIEKDADGNLQATDTEMDMTFIEAKVDMKNLGAMGGILQSVMSAAGPVLFEAIKPSILKEVNSKIRTQVNTKIRAIGNKFSIPEDDASPIDKAVAEGRRYVREKGYDPYRITDKSLVAGNMKLAISEFVLSGLSRFYRVGDVSLSMGSGNVQAGIHLATKRLYGSCSWTASLSDFFNKQGEAHFTIKQLQVKAKVNQSLDVQNPPKLDQLDIFLGSLRLNVDKTENLSFIIELVVNSMPALIRHMIVDTLEIPIRTKVQEILNQVDVQKLLNDTLPELDDMGL